MSYAISPRLVVQNVDDAIAYYEKVLHASSGNRQEQGGLVVHAEVYVGDQMFSLTTEVTEWGLLSPRTLGGSPMLITLEVDDAKAVGETMTQSGGTVIIPIEDRPYGKCEGRVQDPAGHLWVITNPL